MQRIEDQSLASRLRAKVNEFTARSAAVVGAATLLFVALPELFR